MLERFLIVLTGPVGGGKTTVAIALAERFRTIGRETAVIDLDLVYRMARQRDGFANEDVWRTARRGAAALADTFFDSGMSVVIVEGGFFNHEEFHGLQDHITASVRSRLVTLNVSSDQALRRAQSDPSPDRTVSRDPEVQQRLHAQFTESLPFLRAHSLMIDANHIAPVDLARSIAESVLSDGCSCSPHSFE